MCWRKKAVWGQLPPCPFVATCLCPSKTKLVEKRRELQMNGTEPARKTHGHGLCLVATKTVCVLFRRLLIRLR